ncbi:MAG: hypothetical protein IT342_07580 [Candidatus Melainabacteria bacterium]|nr:hypothetical protein [Candidatus Melainabacteria bacterium]
MSKSKSQNKPLRTATDPHLKSPTSYEDAVNGADDPRMTKVSVTVERGLLTFVDHYVQAHSGCNRSEIFDRALEMWAKETQKKSDIACYSSSSAQKSKETSDWEAVQMEAAKEIW